MEEDVDKAFEWGRIEELEEEEQMPSEEEEEEEEEDEEGAADVSLESSSLPPAMKCADVSTAPLPLQAKQAAAAAAAAAPHLGDGTQSTMTGISSQLPGGMETPDAINLRKDGATTETPLPIGDRKLYQVLQQKAASVGGGIMGSDHVYVIPGAQGGEFLEPWPWVSGPWAAGGSVRRAVPPHPGKDRPLTAAEKRMKDIMGNEAVNDVDVSFTPEELEGLDDKALKELYEGRVAEERARRAREDFSDLVAEKARAQMKKLEKDKAKKDKDKEKFKF